ncbi:hypothetical protein Spla01_05107 [Streptomyces platensis]
MERFIDLGPGHMPGDIGQVPPGGGMVRAAHRVIELGRGRRRPVGPVGARQIHPGVVPGLERGDPGDLRVVPVPGPPVVRPGRVIALHGRVDGVAVLVGGDAGVPGQGLGDQRLGVAVQVPRERLGAHRPEGVVVAGLQERRLELAGADLPVERCAAQLARGLVVGLLHRLLGGAQVVPVVVPGDPAQPVAPAALEGDVLVEVVPVPDLVGRGIDHTVEDHPPYVAGEQRRVDRTEVRPVRGAHERQLLLAERGPQHVQVAGVVDGVVVRQVRAGPADTAAGVRPGLRPLPALEGGIGVHPAVGGRLGELLGVLARQRRGAAHTPWRVAHEVIGTGHLAPLGQRPVERELHAGRAGAAGVEDQRALPFAARRGADPADGEVDLLAVGARVVERNGESAALDGRRQMLHRGAAAEFDAVRSGCGWRGGGPRGAACRGSGEGGHQQRPDGAVQRKCSHWPSLRVCIQKG